MSIVDESWLEDTRRDMREFVRKFSAPDVSSTPGREETVDAVVLMFNSETAISNLSSEIDRLRSALNDIAQGNIPASVEDILDEKDSMEAHIVWTQDLARRALAGEDS